jgi:hypothetical protein
MCNCIKYLLYLFFTFSLVQIQMRWKRDATHVPRWGMYVRANASVEQNLTLYSKSVAYGTPPVQLFEDRLMFTEQYETFGIFHVRLKGKPLTYHTVTFELSHTRLERTIGTSTDGVGDIDVVWRFVVQPDTYLFIHYDPDQSTVSTEAYLYSGVTDVWDTPFSTLFK